MARDSAGDLVVIELKRHDQSARQALHELEKYVGLLAADRGIRVDRLRCILLSTTWHELLVPFARFVTHADFHVTGRVLELADDGWPVGSSLVALPQADPGLEICPLHLVLLFRSGSTRDTVREQSMTILGSLGVEDFVTADIDYTGTKTTVIYPHGCYLTLAAFSHALREDLRPRLEAAGSLVAELDDDDEQDESPWWWEQLVQERVVEAADADEVNVVTPERFSSLKGWEVSALAGHGRFDDPAVWSPEQLRRTLTAEGTSQSMPFTRQVAVANKPAWARMRHGLATCLEGAGQWPEIVAALLDELEQRPSAEVQVYAYAPHDVLGGLEMLVRSGTDDYLPRFVLAWKDGSTSAMVGGRLAWDGETVVASVDTTLGAVFRDFMDYLMARVSGALVEVESELCALHGLRYEIGEWGSWHTTGTPDRVEVGPDGVLTRSPIGQDERGGEDFVDAHLDYLAELVDVFDKYTARV